MLSTQFLFSFFLSDDDEEDDDEKQNFNISTPIIGYWDSIKREIMQFTHS